MRRPVSGMPRMLLAMLLLVGRLISPAMSMPSADPVAQLALQSICHAEAPAQPAEPGSTDHADCLLCPACHLVAQAALPTPAPIVPPPAQVLTDIGAPLPPATGPPSRIRPTAQPTGPPNRSA